MPPWNVSNEKGIAHVLLLVLMLAGLGLGVYLAGKQTFFKPKASLDSTRIEFVDNSGKVIEKTSSRNVKLRVVYVFPSPSPEVSPVTSVVPSVAPSPSLAPTPKPLPAPPVAGPAPFTREWGVNWEKIPAGAYTLSFNYSNPSDIGAKVPTPFSVDVKPQATTEVKVSSDGKILDCGAVNCVKYYPDQNIPAGQLRVETVPPRPFQITVTASSVLGVQKAYAYSPNLPEKVRLANGEGQSVKEAFREGNYQEFPMDMQAETVLAWQLSKGAGRKRVYAQFVLTDGSVEGSEDGPIYSEIELEKDTSDLMNLADRYRDPSLIKTHYLHQFVTQADLVKHPGWDKNWARDVLWFEQKDQNTFLQYNISPADPKRDCHYDQLSVWDDNTFRYVASGDKEDCSHNRKDLKTVFEPPMIYAPKLWDGQKWSYSGTSKQTDYSDGKPVCSKTNTYTNEVLGWEEIAPGVSAIHIRTHQKTTESTCPGAKTYFDWEENYWLAQLPVEGSSEPAWGLKRSMGGELSTYYSRPECQLSDIDYAKDERAKIWQAKGCPTYWDIWFDTYKKLPEAPVPVVKKGMLRVETRPAIGASIVVTPLDDSGSAAGSPLNFKWGVNWEKLNVGKYNLKFGYPLGWPDNVSQVVEIKADKTTEVVVNGTAQKINVVFH